MNTPKYRIDRISFQLGMINCFVEMVACGVKRLALSPPVSPQDYPLIEPLSAEIVRRFHIRSYLEHSLMITELQTEEFTRGKWTILYYEEAGVLQAYHALKARQKHLQDSGRYDLEARRDLSREFMRLLSYPESKIEQKLQGAGEEDPPLLI
jgi:hypothetical protein